MNFADPSQVSVELHALASDVLQFLRRVETAVTTATEDRKQDLLLVAGRIMEWAGGTSEVAKETLSEEAALDRIACMRREIARATRAVVRPQRYAAARPVSARR